VTGGSISAKLFNGLVRIGDDLSIQPDLAENWTVSQDGLIYTFQMRKGVYFSNNQLVTAHDVKYSFKRILSPKTRSPQTWVLDKIQGSHGYMDGKTHDIKGLKVIDDFTIEISLEEPFSPFLSLLTMTAAYIVPKGEVEKWGQDFSSHPVGTGPFVLKRWVQNQEIQMVRRDDYFGVPANVQGIVYRIIPEDLTAVTEFEIGNIDVLTIPVSEYSRYKNDPEKSHLISSIRGLNTYYLGLNCSKEPFNNPALRKAIHYAIDREKILNTIYEKRGRLASGPVPDIMRNWDLENIYTYDPYKSAELLKAQGREDLDIDFFVTADQEVIDIAEVIQSYLNDLGIDVNIKRLEWSAYKEAIDKGEPDMFYLSWWADYPDPENFLFPLFHSKNFGPAGNRVRYQDSMVDSFIEKGQNAHDINKRDMFYRQAEEKIVSDAPWVFLWHRTDFTVRQPWIKNYKIYPVYHMDKGTEISL
jgi:peptide/nickel transport system substrate-binding protein/oligopeptide transport system substrate-binding protein